ncbi:MAG: hypothetical protein BWY09_02531 [Candidatus Hydrogenedentes bacterium ADurb.Bin179]|nr:MAG: hypothetical protein BWY09_02531 [Candidatus Hydrogenedentes bacterium ADurb.Bin179]
MNHRAAPFVLADEFRGLGATRLDPGQVQLRAQVTGRGFRHENFQLGAVIAIKFAQFPVMVVIGQAHADFAQFCADSIQTCRTAFPGLQRVLTVAHHAAGRHIRVAHRFPEGDLPFKIRFKAFNADMGGDRLQIGRIQGVPYSLCG